MSKAIEKQEETAIVEYGLPMSIESVKQAFITNFGQEKIKVKNLERAENPSRKDDNWTIPGLEEEDERTSEVMGVIVLQKLTRAMWDGDYEGGSDPPLCSSKDGNSGEGNPGNADCWSCPMAKGQNIIDDDTGKKKWLKPECHIVKQIFMRRPGHLLPTLFTVNAVNMDAVATYMTRLIDRTGKPYHHVVTKMQLAPAVSKGGFDYAKLRLSLVEYLSDEQCAEQDAYQAMVTPLLSDVQLAEVAEDEPPRPIVGGDDTEPF